MVDTVYLTKELISNFFFSVPFLIGFAGTIYFIYKLAMEEENKIVYFVLSFLSVLMMYIGSFKTVVETKVMNETTISFVKIKIFSPFYFYIFELGVVLLVFISIYSLFDWFVNKILSDKENKWKRI